MILMRNLIIYNKIFLEHDTDDYGIPETRERLESFSDLKETDIINGEKYLKLVHDDEIDQFFIFSLCGCFMFPFHHLQSLV